VRNGFAAARKRIFSRWDYLLGMTFETNELAAAWFDAMARLCDATPAGRRIIHGDALVLVSGAAIPSLNVAAGTTPDPGPVSRKTLDEAATEVARAGLPWSVTVRGAAGDAVTALAARHGLTKRGDLLLMGCAAREALLRADEASSSLIHPVSAADSKVYTDALGEGFGVPCDVFGSLMGGGVLDAPGFAGYLAEVDGQPVATGLGVRSGRAVGVFNISTVPSARRRGLGRAMTVRVMADAFAADADTAYLNPSQVGLALYESLGFRGIETWTTFTAG
jgi:ribosomal protein S18 acetylase RimI-like enzyme